MHLRVCVHARERGGRGGSGRVGSPTDLLLVLCLPHIKGELSGLELEAPPSATHTGDLCGPTESAATVVTVVVRGGGGKDGGTCNARHGWPRGTDLCKRYHCDPFVLLRLEEPGVVGCLPNHVAEVVPVVFSLRSFPPLSTCSRTGRGKG